MTDNQFTLVFQIEDHEAFREFLKEPLATMTTDSPDFHGGRVIAAGWENSVARADELAEICEEEGIYLPEHLR